MRERTPVTRRTEKTERRHTPLERTFEELMKTPFNMFGWEEESTFRADIKEKDDAYMIEAELPGLNREDINIELDNDVLIINVDHHYEEEREWTYLQQERRHGKYRRTFHIENIDEESITAEFDRGILEIYLPKEEPGRRRRKIEIE